MLLRYNKHILPFFSERDVRSINYRILDEFLQKISQQDEPKLSVSTRAIDTLTLARNARTSPEMIDRFYAAPLQGEMNVGMLQSKRNPKPWELSQG